MKHHLLLFIFLIALTSSQAQVKPMTTAALPAGTVLKANSTVPVLKMADYKLTPTGQARQAQLTAAFSNPSETVVYTNEPTRLHFNLVKNPTFGNQQSKVYSNTIWTSGGAPVHGATAPPPSPSGSTCTTSLVTVNATSTSFLNADYATQGSHIYPGAIYTADNFFNGSFKEETAARNQIIIGTDNPNINGSSFVTIASPNQNTIRDAIATIYRRFTGPAATSSLVYQTYQSSNSADMSLKTTQGGSGYGFEFTNFFGATTKQNHVYVTVDGIKTMYTINVTPPSNGFFTDPSQESKPNLIFIGAVTYGVRVLANLDIAFNSQSDADKFAADYSGYGITANVGFDYLTNSSTSITSINGYVVGGAGNTTMAFTQAQLQTQMSNALASATFQNARPISYTLYDMAGDLIGIQSATDQFYVQQCYPNAQPANVQSATVSFYTNDDDKDKDTYYNLNLYAGNTLIATYTSPSNNDVYPNRSSKTVQLSLVGSHTIADFLNGGGGKLSLNIHTNGNDTWKISAVVLTLGFQSAAAKTISWNPVSAAPGVYNDGMNIVTVSNNGPNATLFFNNGFTANQ
jgi:hypothetical protein